jgi:hypothetical protein
LQVGKGRGLSDREDEDDDDDDDDEVFVLYVPDDEERGWGCDGKVGKGGMGGKEGMNDGDTETVDGVCRRSLEVPIVKDF